MEPCPAQLGRELLISIVDVLREIRTQPVPEGIDRGCAGFVASPVHERPPQSMLGGCSEASQTNIAKTSARNTHRPLHSQSVGAECSVRRATIDSAVSERSQISRVVTVCDRTTVNVYSKSKQGCAYMQHTEPVWSDVVDSQLAAAQLLSDLVQCRPLEPRNIHDSRCLDYEMHRNPFGAYFCVDLRKPRRAVILDF